MVPIHILGLYKRQSTHTACGSYLSYFRPTKFKTHYIASQFFIFHGPSKLRQIAFIEMCIYLSFGLILQDIPNSITPQNTLHLLAILVRLLVLPCTCQCRRFPPPLLPPPFLSLSRTEEPVKAGACAHDRCALHKLALNVHVKHFDLTWPDLTWHCLWTQITKQICFWNRFRFFKFLLSNTSCTVSLLYTISYTCTCMHTHTLEM